MKNLKRLGVLALAVLGSQAVQAAAHAADTWT